MIMKTRLTYNCAELRPTKESLRRRDEKWRRKRREENIWLRKMFFLWRKRKTEKRIVWKRTVFFGSIRTQKKKRRNIFVAGKSLTGQGEEGR